MARRKRTDIFAMLPHVLVDELFGRVRESDTQTWPRITAQVDTWLAEHAQEVADLVAYARTLDDDQGVTIGFDWLVDELLPPLIEVARVRTHRPPLWAHQVMKARTAHEERPPPPTTGSGGDDADRGAGEDLPSSTSGSCGS